ncbi:MAG: histidine phosphatase family protein [Gammaproteobacteria bacterium]|nr:histidine phosphatase family protein [Gammaproteobacteria bacterium]HJN96961.1 histidine phosphatase family protein [Gammaproteobacteria bacterium]
MSVSRENPHKKIIVDFIRHGEPEGGDILRGRVDPVLTDAGWAQMRTATALNDANQASPNTPPWTEIITSPLKRCRHFAERTAQQINLPASVMDQWQEIDYGDWDGMLVSEWRKVAAEQFKAFRDDLSALAPPNGEDYLSFKQRVLDAWQAVADKPDGSHLLVVTHGGVLRVILPTVLGMPLNRSFPLFIPFACFSRISLQEVEGKLTASLLFHNGAEYGAGPLG